MNVASLELPQPMYLASLELCKELYELSGWEMEESDTYYKKFSLSKWARPVPKAVLLLSGELEWQCPAYDLGYLLRKLPGSIGKGYWNTYLRMSKVKGSYAFAYMDRQLIWTYEQVADTPEDAACKLAIELFKKGMLK